MSTVKIGSSFFRNELKEYDNWHWAIIREAIQNSIDAKGSRSIDIAIYEDDSSTHLIWENNGESMTREVLTDKLLNLGESGKRFEGTVGGFGKAKVLLYFAHSQYRIFTGDLQVYGQGGDYEIQEAAETIKGTRSHVVIEGHHASELREQVHKLCRYLTWTGNVYLWTPGSQDRSKLTKATNLRRRSEIELGTIYTNRSEQNTLVVRSGGIPMFSCYNGYSGLVVVDLKATTGVLTANRDGLTWQWRSQLEQFLTELGTNSNSAFRVPNQTIKYPGYKYHYHPEPKKIATPQPKAVTTPVAAYSPKDFTKNNTTDFSPHSYEEQTTPEKITPEKTTPVQDPTPQFFLRNASGRKIPKDYLPESFSTYAKKLLHSWTQMLIKLHHVRGMSGTFSVGFVFEPEVRALYQKDENEVIYYIAPVDVSNMKKAWKLDYAGKQSLLAVAAHELVHGMGYGYHGESFACAYTDFMGEVLAKY